MVIDSLKNELVDVYPWRYKKKISVFRKKIMRTVVYMLIYRTIMSVCLTIDVFQSGRNFKLLT